MSEKERRQKIISIDADFLVDVLNWWRNPIQWIALPVTDELPEDCVVVSVSASWERCCIEAIVSSSQFPVVKAGDLLERIPGMITKFRYIEIGAKQNE